MMSLSRSFEMQKKHQEHKEHLCNPDYCPFCKIEQKEQEDAKESLRRQESEKRSSLFTPDESNQERSQGPSPLTGNDA